MVMSMNGMGGYGSYGMYGGGMQNSGMYSSGNVPSQLMARYGYSFDFYERPTVAKAAYAITPKAQPPKNSDSKFMRFLKMIF